MTKGRRNADEIANFFFHPSDPSGLGCLCTGKVLEAELEIFYIYQVGNAAHSETCVRQIEMSLSSESGGGRTRSLGVAQRSPAARCTSPRTLPLFDRARFSTLGS